MVHLPRARPAPRAPFPHSPSLPIPGVGRWACPAAPAHVARRRSKDLLLTLCDGSPELMGASGGDPDPPMAPGLIPGIGDVSLTTILHHRRASPPSPPSTSPPPRALPPLSFLLHLPPHGSTSEGGPWPGTTASSHRPRQPDARTASREIDVLRPLRASMARVGVRTSISRFAARASGWRWRHELAAVPGHGPPLEVTRVGGEARRSGKRVRSRGGGQQPASAPCPAPAAQVAS